MLPTSQLDRAFARLAAWCAGVSEMSEQKAESRAEKDEYLPLAQGLQEAIFALKIFFRDRLEFRKR